MKKPTAARKAKPEAPNVVIVDKVAGLAAGLERGLRESGWSMRGLAKAAGLTDDRLRNVARGRSTALQGDAVAQVADVLGVSEGELTGADPWPVGGPKPKPQREKKLPVPVSGELAELAAEAQGLATAARMAMQAAIEIAAAAERVAAQAAAALARPPESADDILDRWTKEFEDEVAARPRAQPPAGAVVFHAQPTVASLSPASAVASTAPTPSSPFPAAPDAAEAAPVPPVTDPDAGYANWPRKRGKPPADPLEQLVWYTKPRVHTVDIKCRQVTLHRKPGKGVTLPSARMDVIKGGGFSVYSLEQDGPVGQSLDAQIAAWKAQSHVGEMDSLADRRKRYPAGCDYIRARGGDYKAELLLAAEIQAATEFGCGQIFGALHRLHLRLQNGDRESRLLASGAMVQQLAAARVWLQEQTVEILSLDAGTQNPMHVPRAVWSVSTLLENMRKRLAELKADGTDFESTPSAVIVLERVHQRLQELENNLKQEKTATVAAKKAAPEH
jgi:lambda repressor-like predicted transcriptional regulator